MTFISICMNQILTMSSKGRRESPEGEIINLVSVDTQHITVFLSFLPYAWSGPIQLILSVYFLYRTIGLAAFAGKTTDIHVVLL